MWSIWILRDDSIEVNHSCTVGCVRCFSFSVHECATCVLSSYEEMLWQAGTRWDVSLYCHSLSLCSHCIYYWPRLPTSGAFGCMYGMSVTTSVIGSNVMYSFQRKTTILPPKFDIIINDQSCIACDEKSLETVCYHNCTSLNWNNFAVLQTAVSHYIIFV